MMTLAIDLGKFTSVACFFDTATQKHRLETIQTQKIPVEHLLATEGIDQVVMEACGPAQLDRDTRLDATLDTGLVANDYPGEVHTRSLIKQSQFTP